MRRIIFTAISIASITIAISAFADNAKAVDACKEIRKVCLAGGYEENSSKDGNDLVIDCINPLMRWENVSRVSIDKAIIQQCRDSLRHHLRRQNTTKKHVEAR